jgi:DNA invertase Pin-like site-specific DNA recombinase
VRAIDQGSGLRKALWPAASNSRIKGRTHGRTDHYVQKLKTPLPTESRSHMDRLSRLSDSDWTKLRAEIDAKQVRIVALDLSTSWGLAAPADDFTDRMFAAVNSMMLDVLAAVARKDYEERRRWQAEGTARAKAADLYKGRSENKARNAAIATMLRDGRSWREIMDATRCSRALLAKLARDIKLGKGEQPA